MTAVVLLLVIAVTVVTTEVGVLVTEIVLLLVTAGAAMTAEVGVLVTVVDRVLAFHHHWAQ